MRTLCTLCITITISYPLSFLFLWWGKSINNGSYIRLIPSILGVFFVLASLPLHIFAYLFEVTGINEEILWIDIPRETSITLPNKREYEKEKLKERKQIYFHFLRDISKKELDDVVVNSSYYFSYHEDPFQGYGKNNDTDYIDIKITTLILIYTMAGFRIKNILPSEDHLVFVEEAINRYASSYSCFIPNEQIEDVRRNVDIILSDSRFDSLYSLSLEPKDYVVLLNEMLERHKNASPKFRHSLSKKLIRIVNAMCDEMKTPMK